MIKQSPLKAKPNHSMFVNQLTLYVLKKLFISFILLQCCSTEKTKVSQQANKIMQTFTRVEKYSKTMDVIEGTTFIKGKKIEIKSGLIRTEASHFIAQQKNSNVSILIGNHRRTSKKKSMFIKNDKKHKSIIPNIIRQKYLGKKPKITKDKSIWIEKGNYFKSKLFELHKNNSFKIPKYKSKPKIIIDTPADKEPVKIEISDVSTKIRRISSNIQIKDEDTNSKNIEMLDLPLMRLSTHVMPDPSSMVVDEDLYKKSPNTLSVDYSNKKEELAKDITRISNINTKIEENYRKINIVWDRSILMRSLKKLGMLDKFKIIRSLIFRVDMALKKYIQLTNESEMMLNIPKGFKHCENTRSDDFNRNHFEKEIYIQADLIIFLVGEDKDNDVLASAAACKINNNNRAYVGRLYLNLRNLDFEYDNYYKQRSNIMVIFHEVLHIMGFEHVFLNTDKFHNFFQSDFIREHSNYLKKLKNLPVSPIDEDFHWNADYFGNDLMSPTERIDNTITIYTLEYLDSISNEIKTNRSALPNNFMLDEITNFKDFFNYKCNDNDSKPDYSIYCSKDELDSRKTSCDRSRLYKTSCSKKELPNNCHSKKPITKYACSNMFQPKEDTKLFETYGNTSRCFNTVKGNEKYHSMCLDFEINELGILIKSEGQEYQCTQTDQIIKMETESNGKRYQLEVVCPEAAEMEELYSKTNCPFNCYGNGFCSNGKCECFDGFNSKDSCKEKTVSTSITRFTSAL
jgi:ssRNA-specific RNase YbeY (16S rRNA maturation enzyme)